MKLVIGIVRPEKANDVLEALYRAEVRGVSLSRVQGHGGELDHVETYRGTTVKMGLSDKIRFEVAVSDGFVQATIDALCEGGRTGEVGDGKVFVIPLERAVRIRTGETDHGAVTLRSSRWISSRNGSSFDGRGSRRYTGGSPERNARRIVLRPWPVRRTISLIDNRFTKYKRRISAHCSTPTTTSSSLEHARPSEAHDHPGQRTQRHQGGQLSTGIKGSVFGSC